MLKRLRFSLVLCLCASIGMGPLLSMSTARASTSTPKTATSSADEHTTNKSAKLVSRSTALHTTSNIRRRPSVRLPQRLASTLFPGQTGTQLTDGRWALIGGEGPNAQLATITIWNPKTNERISVPTELHHARAWHTATMLPDGTILVFGGLGITGQVLASAEIFNPETGSTELLMPTGLTPRTYHTATLLTDGRVLIAGGMSDSAQTLASADIFEPFARVAKSLPKGLAFPRQGQLANLLPNGNVLVSRGVGKDNQELTDGEVFDPQSQQFTPADGSTVQIGTTESATAPRLEASLPSDGATDVAETARITLRFSKALNVQSVNNGALQLSGPSGTVDTKLVAAEDGMLVFIAPKSVLEQNTSYNLLINGLSDNDARTSLQSQITFTTKSAHNHADTKPNVPIAPTDSVWQPDMKGVNSWRTKAERSAYESMSPLLAPPGVTALAGQALKLNGQPLVNIAVSLDDQVAMTDEAGRYLLSPVGPGHHVIVVNDHHHSTIAQAYGMFDISVDVKAGRTNVLPYINWIPLIDTQHATHLSVPTRQQVIAKSSVFPGFEMRIPRNVTFRTTMHGRESTTLNTITITPLPLDRSPMPMPVGMKFAVAFQTHGATVEGAGKGQGVQITFPNVTHLPPGRSVDLMSYDAAAGGWKTYGKGYVTNDGLQISPGPGVILPRLACPFGYLGNDGPGTGPKPCGCSRDGDPVDLGTGLFVLSRTDLAISDSIPLVLSRTYRQGDMGVHSFGVGAYNGFDINLEGDFVTYSNADLVLPDGGNIHYTRTSSGNNFNDAVMVNTTSPTPFNQSVLSWDTALTGWVIRLKDGTQYQFANLPIGGNAFIPLTALFDRYNNGYIVTRDISDGSARAVQVTTTNGRWIQFLYEPVNNSPNNRVVTKARDNIGRTVSYGYDNGDRLTSVTDANGGITQYTYDSVSHMLTLRNPKNNVYLTNQYNGDGRVSLQTQADNTTYQFSYTTVNGVVTQTDVTDPRGNVRRVTFNSDGYALTDTRALGKPEQQTITYVRQAGTNKVSTITDPLGRQKEFIYDSQGNNTSITRMAGTSEASTITFGYDPSNLIVSATDQLNHTVSLGYDEKGSLISATDALGNQTSFTYDSHGQLVSATDALGKTTHYTYSGGDLISVTDPLGRTRSRFVDNVGRSSSQTDPLGRTGRTTYDALNHPTQTIDPKQGTTSFSYDADGHLLQVTDAQSNSINYIYDNMDRVITRRDPLLHDISYQYDENGNLKQTTNRKLQVTAVDRDALNRVTKTTYADSSTTEYHYDLGNRLTSVVDSISGTISYTYDDFDRVTTETTPQGTVTYTHDDAGRVVTMTVTGQATVNYSYDAANRLTQISQGSSTISLTYDPLGRRATLTQPNGIVTQYYYDDASQVIGQVFRKNSTTVGSLTYKYDLAGHRSAVGGSFANTALPTAVSVISYDSANKQNGFGSASLTYDLNGSLTSDGTTTYTWDARNKLSSMSNSSVTASFQYDAWGRRISKTVNGVTTSYLYSGSNVVQEQSGSANTNILTGRIDEVFARTDSNGTTSILRDANGNSIAVTDSTGAIQTQYSYEPFGQTTATNTLNSNSNQYAGRENDGTGLYYNRARYYSPRLQRFISEDPIGLGGGINQYAYANNNPISLTDPSGLDAADFNNFLGGLEDELTTIGLPFIGSVTLSKEWRKAIGDNSVCEESQAYHAGKFVGVVVKVIAAIASVGGAAIGLAEELTGLAEVAEAEGFLEEAYEVFETVHMFHEIWEAHDAQREFEQEDHDLRPERPEAGTDEQLTWGLIYHAPK